MLVVAAQSDSTNPPLLRHDTIRVGDVSVSLRGPAERDCELDAGLGQFCVAPCPGDIEVRVEWAERLLRRTDAPHFDSGSLWSSYRDDREFVFDFCSSIISDHPYKRLRIDDGFRCGRLILNREALAAHCPISPLEYPADELLVTSYLAHHGLGVEVHGCGFVDSETGGHLLLGHSGAGKSTTAQLWQSRRNPEILSDDRLILRLHDGELWMYGTPWHGEGRFALPGKSKLNKILVLQHGQRNRFVELSRSHAAAELFARCFPPFHSPAGLQGVVQFLDRVVNAVPCYEFQFVPDVGAVDAVIEMDYANACN
jgi:hypothetical protein